MCILIPMSLVHRNAGNTVEAPPCRTAWNMQQKFAVGMPRCTVQWIQNGGSFIRKPPKDRQVLVKTILPSEWQSLCECAGNTTTIYCPICITTTRCQPCIKNGYLNPYHVGRGKWCKRNLPQTAEGFGEYSMSSDSVANIDAKVLSATVGPQEVV